MTGAVTRIAVTRGRHPDCRHAVRCHKRAPVGVAGIAMRLCYVAMLRGRRSLLRAVARVMERGRLDVVR